MPTNPSSTLHQRVRDWTGKMLESPIVHRHDSAILVESAALIRDLAAALTAAEADADVLQGQIDDHFIPRALEAEHRLNEETAKIGARLGEARQQLTAAEADRQRLRTALEQYGAHSRDCDVFSVNLNDCSCGLDALLSSSPET